MNKTLFALMEIKETFPEKSIKAFSGKAPIGEDNPDYEAIEDFLRVYHGLSSSEVSDLKKLIKI